MNKVVPFERDAAYLHQRAGVNRREKRALDALELYRRAVERAPDNRQYRMDLAEMYCEMGCYRLSAQVLKTLLAEDAPPNDCYFGLSCNYFGMARYDDAYQAMLQLLLRDQTALERGEVKAMFGRILALRSRDALNSRRAARAKRLFRAAVARLREGAYAHAARLCSKSLLQRPGQPRVIALMALAQAEQGQRKQALHALRRAMALARGRARALILCAYGYRALNDDAAARRIAGRLTGRATNAAWTRELICLLARLGMHEALRPILRQALKSAPFDREYLFLSAVNAARLGRPVKQAQGYLTRMRRIDPNDPVSRVFSDDATCIARLKRIDDAPAFLRAHTPEDAEMPLDGFETRLCTPIGQMTAGVVGARMPLSYLKALKMAVYALDGRGLDGEATAQLFQRAIAYCAQARRHPLRAKRAWAAALLWTHLRENAHAPSVEAVAGRFACSARRVKRYAKKLQIPYPGGNE